MFSQTYSSTNFKFDTEESTLRALLRHIDFAKWYFSLTNRSHSFVNRHELVENEKDLNKSLDNLRLKTFRGFSITSFNVKSIFINEKPYTEYGKEKSSFQNEYPSHPDYRQPIVKWITLGSIYGDSIVIDAAKVTPKMLSILMKFLHEKSTIVVSTDQKTTAWHFHLTFGPERFKFSEFQKMAADEQNAYKSLGILKNLRVFDFSSIVTAVKAGHPGYSISDWEALGIEPEGESVWHLAQAFLGLDLIGNDANNVPNPNSYWAVSKLDNVQAKLIEIEAQSTVLTFLALLRYKLCPDAHKIIVGYEHDFRSPKSFDKDIARFSKYETDRSDEIFAETRAIINFRDGLTDIGTDLPLCIASAASPEMYSRIRESKYRGYILPILCEENTEEVLEVVDNYTEVSQEWRIDNVEGIESTPGNLPFFICSTHPRTRQDGYKFMREIQSYLKCIAQRNRATALVKKVAELNWLQENGEPTENLARFLNRFPKTSPAQDCFNHMASSYPIFKSRNRLSDHGIRKPQNELLSSAEYKTDPFFAFRTFYMSKPESYRNLDLFATLESVDNLKIVIRNDVATRVTPRDPQNSPDLTAPIKMPISRSKRKIKLHNNPTKSQPNRAEKDLLSENKALRSKLKRYKSDLNDLSQKFAEIIKKPEIAIVQEPLLVSTLVSVTVNSLNEPVEETSRESGQTPYKLYIDHPLTRGDLTNIQLAKLRESFAAFQANFNIMGRITPSKRLFIADQMSQWCKTENTTSAQSMLKIFLRVFIIASLKPPTLEHHHVIKSDHFAIPIYDDILQYLSTGRMHSQEKLLAKRQRNKEKLESKMATAKNTTNETESPKNPDNGEWELLDFTFPDTWFEEDEEPTSST